MPALSIPIHELDTVGRDYVFALDESWLREAFAGSDVNGDPSRIGSVNVHAQRNGSEILVHGKADARLITECVRCLSPVAIDVACDVAALYAPSATRPRENADDDDLEIDPEAPDREYYSGDNVLIDDLVRDYLLLELPMQPRCEPECQTLGATNSSAVDTHVANDFGEGTIDPRLMPLMKLVKGEPQKE